MNDASQLTPNWTRQLGDLRSRALREGLRRRGAQTSLGEVLEDALTTWGSLLKDYAVTQVECERLRAEASVEAGAWEHFFDIMPVACVVTEPDGVIRSANQAAALLFHVSARHLRERQLLFFVEDRAVFGDLLRRLADRGEPRRVSLTVRPRERRPVETDAIVAADERGNPGLIWFFVASGPPVVTSGD